MLLKNLLKKYDYILKAFGVIISWGLVPLFAKIGNLPGGQTTMWVDSIGAIGVFLIMLISGKIHMIKKNLPYGKFLLFGLVWPLTYSVLYFNADKLGGPSLLTITNYTWPAFAMVVAYLLLNKKRKWIDWAVILLAIGGVIYTAVTGTNLKILMVPIVLGILAAAAQAIFNVLTSTEPPDQAWVLTLVIQMVGGIGGLIYTLLFETTHIPIPSLNIFTYLVFLGLVSGSFGFWAFVSGMQSAHNLGDKKEIMFYILLCLVPIVQVLVLMLPFWHTETVSNARLIGVAMVFLSLLIFQISSWITRKT